MTAKDSPIHRRPPKFVIYAIIFAICALFIATWTGVLAGFSIRSYLIIEMHYHIFRVSTVLLASAYLLVCIVALAIAVTYMAIFVNHLLQQQPVDQVPEGSN